MDNRKMIIVDGYKFEVNTIGKYTESHFRDAFKDLPNFHWQNAYRQIKKEFAKLNVES
jgi:hypothetical protein